MKKSKVEWFWLLVAGGFWPLSLFFNTLFNHNVGPVSLFLLGFGILSVVVFGLPLISGTRIACLMRRHSYRQERGELSSVYFVMCQCKRCGHKLRGPGYEFRVENGWSGD